MKRPFSLLPSIFSKSLKAKNKMNINDPAKYVTGAIKEETSSAFHMESIDTFPFPFDTF
jgi:hypothetical protein